jgi:hypothetical protein
MIVPILLEYVTSEELRDSRSLFYFCRLAVQGNAPLIVRENYLKRFAHISEEIAQGIQTTRNSYRLVFGSNEDIDIAQAVFYEFPEALETELIAQHDGSINNLYASLLTERSKEFENWLEEAIEKIEEAYGEKIDAFYTVLSSNLQSLKQIAQKHDIPIIYYDWGTFRSPVYRDTRVIDFNSFLSEDGVRSRFQEFLVTSADQNTPLLSRREILTLFLRDEYLNLLDHEDDEPEFELGIATGYAFFMPALAQTFYNDEELMYRAYSHYRKDEILVRTHPKDPLRTRYPLQAYIRDTSRSSTEFILRCRKVVSLFSNVSMEALYWNRVGYAVMDSHVSYGCQRDLGQEKTKEVEDSFLNFYALCFNVPAVCWDDYDYLKWRVGHPSELEIFNRHLQIWRDTLESSASESVRQKNGTELLSNSHKVAKGFTVPNSLAGFSLTQVYEMAARYLKVKESKSWKATKPLRALRKLFAKK